MDLNIGISRNDLNTKDSNMASETKLNSEKSDRTVAYPVNFFQFMGYEVNALFVREHVSLKN